MPPAILDSGHSYFHTPDTVSSFRVVGPPHGPTRRYQGLLRIYTPDTATATLSSHADSYRFPDCGSDPSASISDSGSSSILMSPPIILTATTPDSVKVVPTAHLFLLNDRDTSLWDRSRSHFAKASVLNRARQSGRSRREQLTRYTTTPCRR